MASQANTVTLSTNFNTSPYYDDFDETKNFHRILFRPGQAVQARELTQMQTILQNQIDRFAEHIFKEGSAVRGCEISPLDLTYDYVKLRNNNNTGSSVNVFSFSDKLVKGQTSGVIAKVVNVSDGSEANTPNFKTIFVDYLSGNSTTGYRRFANNEILFSLANTSLKANTITSLQGGTTGYGSAVTVGSGIIFGKDHFIRVDQQTIVLDKYTNLPTYRVGFNIQESIIESANDSSLLDPAYGAFNYAAPGANRLKLTPVLTKTTSANTFTNNFIEFVNIKNGIIQTKSDTPQYSIIRDELAKRTREESGDYIVRGLATRVREHLLSGNNQGVYTALQGGLATKLSIDVEPGKAYVQGYDNELLVTQHVAIDKGIDYRDVDQVSTYADIGNFVVVDNFVGSWDLDGQNLVILRGRGTGVSGQANAVSNRTYSSATLPGAAIGKARVRGIELLTGTPGTPSAQYKLYLTDIRITTAGKSFANTESISYDANTGFADGLADVLGSNNRNANTNDQAFNTAIFRLPASAIRRLRDAANTIDNSFGFWKTAHGAVSTSGILTLSLSGDEQFTGSGTLSDSIARANYHVIVRSSSANTSTLTGTVSTTSGSNTVTGSGTAFTTQINAGDLIRISNTGTTRYLVSQVVSDTSLKLLNTVGATKTGMSVWKEFVQGQILDMGGVGRDGDRAIIINSTTSATVDINETMAAGFNATVHFKAQKTDVQEAGKTLNRDKLVQIKMGTSGTTGYTANTSGPWPLGLSDGFRLVSVRKKTGTFSSVSDGVDVTNHFYLDNGQRDAFYDHAQLVKKTTSGLSITASDRLLVKLDFFTHTNRDRGYFSIDSYPVNDTTAGSNSQVMFTYEIPIFTSPVSGVPYDLRNCVDFRPKLTNSANSVSSLTNISTNPFGIATPNFALSAPDFDEPTGGLRFPYTAALFQADLSYYLGRKDLIVMDADGKCQNIRGVASLTPTTPPSDSDKMTIASIEITPYPSLPDELAKRVGRTDLSNTLRTVKNERFTMRDIGVIRDRVERLEYYTTLSLLEQDASTTIIRDSDGVDRFKNGFLVDGFTGHAVGNVYDPDYKIAIDPGKKEMRPSAKIDNIELFYNAANSSSVVRSNFTTSGYARDQVITVANSQVAFTNGASISSGGVSGVIRFKFDNKVYIEEATGSFVQSGVVSTTTISSVAPNPAVMGRIITLPYKHDKVITQPFASTTRNTAGLAYNWVGTIALEPNSDYWVDTVTLPEVQINIDNSVDNWETNQNSFGTQWGSWETVATGVPVLQSTDRITSSTGIGGSAMIGGGTLGGPGAGWINLNFPASQIITNVETYTQDVTQQRVGTTMGVSLSTQTQTIGNIVRDVNIQPFMRSRVIKVTGRGFKPSSRLYSFFDGVNVSSYITPTNSAFANTANEGSALRSDSSGNIYGLFRIPNQPSVRFRTGEKIFRLTDNPTNDMTSGLLTTAGQTNYAAQGLITQNSDLTVSTSPSEVVTNTLVETRTIQQVSTVQTQSTTEPFQVSPINLLGFENPWQYVDPICQTFTVDCKAFGRVVSSGAFISKIDLYFATKDSSLPVIVEIREIDPISGYPTPRLVPYGRAIVESSQVNTSADGSKPTPVYFPSPVFVQDERQYGIVIIPAGGNPNYSCWISRLGENDLVSGNRITTQPATGILFASSNDTTYTALQEEDLKFSIYFANFIVSRTGVLTFKNEIKDYFTVTNASSTSGYSVVGETVHGETYIKGTLAPGNGLIGNVAHDQSFAQGMVSGATGIITYISTANGDMRLKKVSRSAKFKGGEAIRFRLTSATSGTITGNSTGGIKFASYPTGKVSFYDQSTSANQYLHIANVSYSNSGPATGTSANNKSFVKNIWITGQTTNVHAKLSNTYSLNADLINVKGDFLIPSNTAIVPSGKFATSTSARDTQYIGINMNADTAFPARRYIHGVSMESNTSLTSSTMKLGSAEIRLSLSSNNRYGSPAFDTSRISSTIVETLLNNSTVGEANNVSGGYADARYITRKVVLAEGQDAEDILVYLDAYKPPNTDVTVYYKVLHREDSDTFAQARWIQMSQLTATSIVSASENKENFIEYQYGVPNYPTGNNPFSSGLYGNSTPTGILSYRNSVRAFFQGFKYFAIKIVLTGTSTTNPPRVRNLRCIALQK